MLKDADLSTLYGELSAAGETEALEGAASSRWSVRGRSPGLVCRPSSAQEMAAALAGCDRVGAAVIPWGGGTQQGLGMPPARADVVLATDRLNRVLEYEPGDLTVTVEAGMPFQELQQTLRRQGQWIPLDPPLLPGATVGGLVATNVSGPRRIRDGGIRDLLIGTRVANVDGTVTRAGGRVVKNVTGYDLNKAHIGSLGTLGILVEVTFKVAPRPETERSWVGIFPSAAAAGRVAARLLRMPLSPTALDLLNQPAATAMGLPVEPGRWLLMGRAGGFAPAVERHLDEFEGAARTEGRLESWRLSEEDSDRLWEAFLSLAAGLRWSGTATTCRLALPPAVAGPLADRLAGLGEGPAVWAHATGATFWSSRVEGAEVGALVSRLRALAEAGDGSLVVENWPPSVEGLEVWGQPAGPLSLMRALKGQYDPHGALNPGRFVGGI